MSEHRIREFFNTEYRRLVGYARHRLAGTADLDAEDFVQDVLVQILARADFIAPLENLAGYVYQSLRNRMIDYFRRKRPAASLDRPLAGDSGFTLADVLRDSRVDPGEALENRDLRAALMAAIRELSETEQALIVATDFEGRTFKSLAADWGMPLNTLLSIKARAVKKLRPALEAWRP